MPPGDRETGPLGDRHLLLADTPGHHAYMRGIRDHVGSGLPQEHHPTGPTNWLGQLVPGGTSHLDEQTIQAGLAQERLHSQMLQFQSLARV